MGTHCGSRAVAVAGIVLPPLVANRDHHSIWSRYESSDVLYKVKPVARATTGRVRASRRSTVSSGPTAAGARPFSARWPRCWTWSSSRGSRSASSAARSSSPNACTRTSARSSPSRRWTRWCDRRANEGPSVAAVEHCGGCALQRLLMVPRLSSGGASRTSPRCCRTFSRSATASTSACSLTTTRRAMTEGGAGTGGGPVAAGGCTFRRDAEESRRDEFRGAFEE